jgi:anthranilate phosphoribosyltransferase
MNQKQNISASEEHPFAQYVRVLGKGKRGARSLSLEESELAMQMILEGKVEDSQLGAFLMLLRVKEESPEEIAGFVRAVQKHIKAPDIHADLDWSSYAGKRKHLPWFLLCALILAENGIKVFMHGSSGHTEGRLYTDFALQSLGITAARNWHEVAENLEEQRFCYMPLQYINPTLQALINMRNLLGLRSPVHTLVRLINPLSAHYSLQSIFHPAYATTHQHAAALLKQPGMAVIKGDGGEFERKADATCLVKQISNGLLSEEKWPRLFDTKHPEPATLNPEILRDTWSGKNNDSYGTQAVIGTLAILLKLMERTDSQEQSMQLATKWWEQRDKSAILSISQKS